VIIEMLGQFSERSPGYALNTQHKIILVNYGAILNPKKISNNFRAPVQRQPAKDFFEELLIGWGIVNFSEWILCIDARDDYWLPHIEMEEAVKDWSTKFKKVVIECNSVFDPADCPHVEISFHPTACITLRNWYLELQNTDVDWKNIEYKKHFIALARRPSVPRVLFVKTLLDNGFGPNLLASCGSKSSSRELRDWRVNGRRPIVVNNPKMNMVNVNTNDTFDDTILKVERPIETTNIKWEQLFFPYKWPMYIDGPIDELNAVVKPDIVFYTNAVNVVCETMEKDTDPVNISEKTFKVFAWHQIPLFHASPGTVEVVRKLGFDLFDDIIDHSYDWLPYEQRRDFIVQQMHKFRQTYPTIESLNQLRKDIWPRLVANNLRINNWVEYESNITKNLLKK